jgi:hypothetical protein
MPDPLRALLDCLSDDRFLHLHLHHHECAIREEAKLSQSVREARAEFIRGALDTAAKEDKTDASEDESRHSWWPAERRAQFEAIKTNDDMAAWVARYCAARGEPRIGMTEWEVVASTTWCLPSHINDTETAGHTRRQLVYRSNVAGSGGHDGYLYFENGRLVAIQRQN